MIEPTRAPGRHGPMLRCPQGHLWQRPEGLSGQKQSGDQLLCPQCGLALSSMGDAQPLADTLPPEDSHAGAPATTVPAQSPASPDAPDSGYRGRFRILRQHARGGLGTVSVAEDETLGRTVALKQIRPELAGRRESRRRFLHEAHITGQLEHPNIVPVYALGRDERGRPYYAMPFVKGYSLHEAIRRYHQEKEKLDPVAAKAIFRDLLGRFIAVCQAVAYAHSQNIVHRDLKPANVMLGEYGQTLVVDWGLAKRVTHDNGDPAVAGGDEVKTERTSTSFELRDSSQTNDEMAALTASGHALGTSGYMAPEQAENPSSAGPKCDVYSLGAILQEILLGTREGGGGRLDRWLQPLLAIARKAKSAAPQDRYRNPLELSADVEQWLADEPVSAFQDPLVTRVGRWARRHRPYVAAAAALAVTALVALAITNVIVSRQRDAVRQALHTREEALRAEEVAKQESLEQARIAREREQEAIAARADADQRAAELEQVVKFQEGQLGELDVAAMGLELRTSLFQEIESLCGRRGLDEVATREQRTLVEDALAGANFTSVASALVERSILQRAIAAVESQFVNQPVVQGRLWTTLAKTSWDLGLYEAGEIPRERAVELTTRLLGDHHPDTLHALLVSGLLLHRQGHLQEAEHTFESALANAREALEADHPVTLNALACLADVRQDQGRLQEAEALIRDCLEGSIRAFGETDRRMLMRLDSMASVLRRQSRYEEAAQYLERALDQKRQVLGDDDVQTIRTLNDLGVLRLQQGQLGPAESLLREALGRQRRVRGDDHPQTIAVLQSLTALLQSTGNLREADVLNSELLERSHRVLGPDHPQTIGVLCSLSELALRMQRIEIAERHARDALQRASRTLGDSHHLTLTALTHVGNALMARNLLVEAEPYVLHSLDGFREILGAEHPDTLVRQANAATLLCKLGRLDEALAHQQEALSGFRKALGEEHPHTLTATEGLGRVHYLRSEATKAEPFFRAALLARQRLLGQHHPHTARSLASVGAVLTRQDRFADAEPYLQEALQLRRRLLGAAHPETLTSMVGLTTLWRLQGKLEEADGMLNEAFRMAGRQLNDSHPLLSDIRRELALLRVRQGEEAEAVELLRTVLARDGATQPAGSCTSLLEELASRVGRTDRGAADSIRREFKLSVPEGP